MASGQRWPHDGLLHAWWVEPGRLLAGEYPGATTPEKAAKKVQLLVDAGVDSIVDLTTPADGLDSYQEELRLAAEEAGRRISHFAYPIPDMSVLDQEGYDRILGRIRDEIDAGRVVYVHCWGGKGRTCTVVGCLLIDDGLDYDSAIARIAELRAGTRKAVDPCPESAAQHRLLRERAARHNGAVLHQEASARIIKPVAPRTLIAQLRKRVRRGVNPNRAPVGRRPVRSG